MPARPVVLTLAGGERCLRGEAAGDKIGERLLGLLPVVLIDVEHQRRDRSVPRVRLELIQAKAGLLSVGFQKDGTLVFQNLSPLSCSLA